MRGMMTDQSDIVWTVWPGQVTKLPTLRCDCGELLPPPAIALYSSLVTRCTCGRPYSAAELLREVERRLSTDGKA